MFYFFKITIFFQRNENEIHKFVGKYVEAEKNNFLIYNSLK